MQNKTFKLPVAREVAKQISLVMLTKINQLFLLCVLQIISTLLTKLLRSMAMTLYFFEGGRGECSMLNAGQV